MGEGGWWCGVGVRTLGLSAGSAHPANGHLLSVGYWGLRHHAADRDVLTRPDPNDPTKTDPVT
jgi:hypothetical protein